jgi:hypothetical protein
MNKSLLWVFLLACGVACAPAPTPQPPGRQAQDTTRHAYEMQEKCANDAREWYKHWWENPKDSGLNIPSTYTNHYNVKLDRCFLVVDATVFGKKSASKMKTLVDVLENREMGAFDETSGLGVLSQCEVAGAHCGSDAEWDALVKPYMEQ